MDDLDTRPYFPPGDVDRILQHWTPEQIARAGVSRTAIAAAACFANRMAGGYDPGGPEDEKPQIIISYIRSCIAENPDYDRWPEGP